jgi:pimeloyl-ACP methyl ester carboxylesterase
MLASEIRDTGRLVGATVDEITIATRDVHRAVAGRLFGWLGPWSDSIRIGHDLTANVAYGSVRAAARVLPVGVAHGLALRATGTSLHSHRRGRVLAAKINGALGRRVEDGSASLSSPMMLRAADGPCTRDVSKLGGPFTGRVVVFVHGLCESDAAWELGAEKAWGATGVSYGSRLRAEHGWTPLYASYDTGRRISVNGAEFAALLEDVVRGWPVPVTELALVGHSMGALVIRSACHQGADGSGGWLGPLRSVVLIGAPNLGAPLERAVNSATHLLNRLPETRPVATLLNQRSAGIKDLRHGNLVSTDWAGFDPEDRADHCTPIPLPAGVDHYVVAATLARSPETWLTPLLTDLLVPWTSATGQHPVRAIGVDPSGWSHVARAHHLSLLNRPDVYRQLATWLG